MKKIEEKKSSRKQISDKISTLGRRILINEYTAVKIKFFDSKLTRVKNVHHLILQSKDEVVIFQILFETKQGAC